MEYIPDKWVVVKITTNDETLYKVFGSWIGGYLSGDSWRMNSGIESVSLDEDIIIFHGFSGSEYLCHKNSYGMTAYSSGVLLDAIEKSGLNISILDKNTDWFSLEYPGKKE